MGTSPIRLPRVLVRKQRQAVLMETQATQQTADNPSSKSEDSKSGNSLQRVASAGLWGTLVALVGGWLLYRGISGGGPPSRALGVSATDGYEHNTAGAPPDALVMERSTTVGKPANELYQFWREPQNVSRIMGSFADITATSDTQAHWVVQGPFGRSAAWDARVVEDRPGELLRWESTEGADLPNEGEVRFRPAPKGWGTEVMLRFRFDPPGGALGEAAVKLLGSAPGLLAFKALYRFKSLVETGEIPTLAKNPSARGSGDTF